MIQRITTGDASLTSVLGRQSAGLRADLQRASVELTTGLQSDLGQAVGGDFSDLAAIDHSLARNRGFAATTAETGLFADALQSALGVISDAATELGTGILGTVGLSDPTRLDALITDGKRQFQTAFAALNTGFGDRALFSGVSADQPPFPDMDAFLGAIETAISGAVTVDDIQTAITDWFASPTGFDALYAGGAPRADVPIAPGETVTLDVTALDPALRDSFKALSTVALLQRGLLSGQHEARSALAKSAGEALLSSGNGRANLAARIGTAQAQIAAATSRNASEESSLGILRAGLVTADPYETAAQVKDLEARLESLYVITSRLSRLSLTEYLR